MNWVHNPDRPAAMMPASMMPMMKEPLKVPKIEPTPQPTGRAYWDQKLRYRSRERFRER